MKTTSASQIALSHQCMLLFQHSLRLLWFHNYLIISYIQMAHPWVSALVYKYISSLIISMFNSISQHFPLKFLTWKVIVDGSMNFFLLIWLLLINISESLTNVYHFLVQLSIITCNNILSICTVFSYVKIKTILSFQHMISAQFLTCDIFQRRWILICLTALIVLPKW